ncbi:hypothetical protein HZH68_011562 [Vespula germanica]|uniref:Uncharacterized protein n=1 Tax=Vespula germanica TaxID=30212 RepID=A0A834JPC4_VESGE|nr:hypothetical protein HZH68_011562 [Vespula germanica]
MLLPPTEAQDDYIVDLLSSKEDASTDDEHETYGEGGVKEGGAWDQSSRFTAVITKITAPHNDGNYRRNSWTVKPRRAPFEGFTKLDPCLPIYTHNVILRKFQRVLLRGALGGCRKVSQTLRLYLGGLMKAIVRLIRNCELLGILFGVSRILGFKLCTENLALRIFCQIIKSEKTLSNEFENIVEAFMEILDNTVTPAVIADVTFNERNQCRL